MEKKKEKIIVQKPSMTKAVAKTAMKKKKTVAKRPQKERVVARRKDGKKFKRVATARRAVWNGKAQKTTGGLKKKDLMVRTRDGRIISKKKHTIGKERYPKTLQFFARAVRLRH